MNLDELQSVQSRERQASSLQHLRASFYEDAGAFIGELREKRNRAAAESDNPFDDPEVERLSDDIRTAERTVESIYERRVGKVVKLASIAAADMPYDEEGLTTEEEQLFDRLADAIERNRDCVLSVLDGEAPSLDCNPVDTGGEASGEPNGTGTGIPSGIGSTTGPEPGTGHGPGVDAESGETARTEPGAGPAGAASEGDPGGRSDPTEPTAVADDGVDRDAHRDRAEGDSTTAGPDEIEGRPTPPDRPLGDESDATGQEVTADRTVPEEESLDIGGAMGGGASDDDRPTARDDPVPATGADAGAGRPADQEGAPGDGGSGDEPVERTTVRVTADVGDIYCVDGRSYDLSAEDVVTLPTPNAEGLVSKDAAERLD